MHAPKTGVSPPQWWRKADVMSSLLRFNTKWSATRLGKWDFYLCTNCNVRTSWFIALNWRQSDVSIFIFNLSSDRELLWPSAVITVPYRSTITKVSQRVQHVSRIKSRKKRFTTWVPECEYLRMRPRFQGSLPPGIRWGIFKSDLGRNYFRVEIRNKNIGGISSTCLTCSTSFLLKSRRVRNYVYL